MANLTVARLALAVLRVDHRFQGMAFSISEEVTIPQVSATQETESQATKCSISSPLKFLGKQKFTLGSY